MAFENSPSLEEPEKPRINFKRWLYLNRRILLAVIGAVIVIALVIIGLVSPTLHPAAAGGLDGCLQTSAGKPLTTTVRIAAISRATSADGCFFFPGIPAGDYQLIISTAPRDVTIPVKIEANQAVGLGTITVSP